MNSIEGKDVEQQMKMPRMEKRGLLILLGCGFLNFSLGAFYAWSVFIEPLQGTLNASRTEVSAVFSIATVFFTLGMIFGSLLFRRIRAAVVAGGCLLVGAAGLALAAGGGSLPMVYLGYGVIFSMANAVGYSLTLQLVNTELPDYAAVATGIVTACYALGSVVSAPVLVFAIGHIGVWNALFGLSLFLVLAAVISSLLLILAKTTMACPPLPPGIQAALMQHQTFVKLWLGFALSALAGLMIISHAAGIVSAYGGAPTQIALGAMLVNLGNITGRFSGGWFSQHFPVRKVLTTVTALAALALLLLAVLPSVGIALLILPVIGFVYGSNGSTYPISVTIYYGKAQMAKVFGILMTAWGLAGLTASWVAGFVFDSTGKYELAILLAASTALISSIISRTLPSKKFAKRPEILPLPCQQE